MFNKNIKKNRQTFLYFYIDNTLSNLQSLTRHIEKTISQHDLERLDRLVFKARDTSAYLAKIKLGLIVSTRTIQRYMNSLSLRWVKIKILFCQVVNHVQRIHIV